MISAQAHIRLSNLRDCVKQSEALPPQTLILVRVDESADPAQCVVRFVGVKNEQQNGSPFGAPPAPRPVELAGRSELDAMSANDLLKGMQELMQLKHPSYTTQYLSYEIETRKRLLAYERSLAKPRQPLASIAAQLPEGFFDAIMEGDFAKANGIMGAFVEKGLEPKASPAPAATYPGLADPDDIASGRSIELAQEFLRALSAQLDAPFAVTDEHVVSLGRLLTEENARAFMLAKKGHRSP